MSEFSAFASDTPLRAVSAEDVKRVWRLTRDVHGTQTGTVGFDIRLVEQQCQPGADLLAVFFRTALLKGLFDQGLLEEWREGNEPADSVFEAAAGFPLKGGVQGFNFEEFLERLRGTAGA